MEGTTRLLVPPSRTERGPAAREAAVFFNPAMALSRDVGVLAVAALAAEKGRPPRILDGLAAGGARGLRYAVEGGASATLNDWSETACELARKNAETNGVAAEVTRRSLPALLWEGAWDMVDVDPFGSPAEFVDAACRAVVNGGILAVTATDTAALHGLYPEVCRRRYLATPLRGEFGHETALRILAGSVVRQAAKHDVAMTPVLAHVSDHAYRVYLRARLGAERANAALERLGFAWLCGACHERGVLRDAPVACASCGGAVRVGGPLWIGPQHDSTFVSSMLQAGIERTLARKEDAMWLLTLLAGEADAPPLFYDAHAVAGRARVDPWTVSGILDALFHEGYAAARSHAAPWGIKTNAPAREFERILQGDRQRVFREIEVAMAEDAARKARK